MDVTDSQSIYLCPGETQPITKSLHLARLAAGYSACYECLHRCETGTLSVEVVNKIKTKSFTDHSTDLKDQFLNRDLIRGIYLNELNRPKVEKITEHVLEIHQEENSQLNHPRILVAHDWRPSSPDLVTGVVAVLRRWGCDIADLGQINRPCFDFAMSQFPADLGIFVTGGIETEKFNGLDILSADGGEWSHSGRLSKLIERLPSRTSRSQRQAGEFQSVSIVESYEEKVYQQFPEIQPMRVALACAEPLSLQILGSLLLKHGCEVNFHELNFSSSDFKKQSEVFRYAVRDTHVDVGVLIRSDGQSVTIFDERGKRVSRSAMLKLSNYKNPSDDENINDSQQSEYLSGLLHLETLNRNSSSVKREIERYRFANSEPQCDAIHVVGKVLYHLSNSTSPLSVVARTVAATNS